MKRTPDFENVKTILHHIFFSSLFISQIQHEAVNDKQSHTYLGGGGEEEKRGKKKKESMKVSTESYKIISVTLEDREMLLILSSDEELSGIECISRFKTRKAAFLTQLTTNL